MPCPARLPHIAVRQRRASSSSSGPGAQRAAQVGLLGGEQAGADLAVGGQPGAVAVAAERPGDAGDDADPAGRRRPCRRPARSRPAPRRARPGRAAGRTRPAATARISSAVTIVVAVPAVLGVQRHLLDEPQLVAVSRAKRSSGRRLVVVDAAHQHRVDLHRDQPGGRRRGQPGQHVGEPVAAGERGEPVRVEGVQRDVDPVQAGRRAAAGASRARPMPLVVSEIRGAGLQRGDGRHDADQARAAAAARRR